MPHKIKPAVLLFAVLSIDAPSLVAQKAGFVSFDAQHGLVLTPPSIVHSSGKDSVDRELTARLEQIGFTGNIEATLEQRLGSPIDAKRANLGRLLWFDT